jgi:hypothetical protein
MTETNLTDAVTPQATRLEMQRYQIFVGIQIFF